MSYFWAGFELVLGSTLGAIIVIAVIVTVASIALDTVTGGS